MLDGAGIDDALEAVAGIGADVEAAGGAADGDGLPRRGLEDDVGGLVADLGVGAAHDAGEGDHATAQLVGDDEFVAGERDDLAVEELEFLALGREPHDEFVVAAGVGAMRGEVEDVGGLAVVRR